MAYEGYLGYRDVEIANLGRTAYLAQAMGVSQVTLRPSDYDWIAPPDAGDITKAPWYLVTRPESVEFIGFIPLSVSGLGDSTRTANTTEYIRDGGATGSSRLATKSFVADGYLIAKTPRGAEYGKRWLESVMAPEEDSCLGGQLWFHKYDGSEGPQALAHYIDVSLTRGVRVTKQIDKDCFSALRVTFTLTADDPHTYGPGMNAVSEMNLPGAPVGPMVNSWYRDYDRTEIPCAGFNYNPVQDPLYPSLIVPPPVPEITPDGWDIRPGQHFQRDLVGLNVYPLNTTQFMPSIYVYSAISQPARRVRVSFWRDKAHSDNGCDPLFQATANYVPTGGSLIIDGHRQASYFNSWAPGVASRPADSIVVGEGGAPVRWSAVPTGTGLGPFISVDTFYIGSNIEGDGGVQATLDIVGRED